MVSLKIFGCITILFYIIGGISIFGIAISLYPQLIIVHQLMFQGGYDPSYFPLFNQVSQSMMFYAIFGLIILILACAHIPAIFSIPEKRNYFRNIAIAAIALGIMFFLFCSRDFITGAEVYLAIPIICGVIGFVTYWRSRKQTI